MSIADRLSAQDGPEPAAPGDREGVGALRDLRLLDEAVRLLSGAADHPTVLRVLVQVAAEACAEAGAAPRQAVVATRRDGVTAVLCASGAAGIRTREVLRGEPPDPETPPYTRPRVVQAQEPDDAEAAPSACSAWVALHGEGEGELRLGIVDVAGNPVSRGRRDRLDTLAALGRMALDRVSACSALRVREAAEQALSARNAELHAIAATDPLTGVANRREFERWVASPPSGRFAVLAIDVDGLKAVNDERGHEAGDTLIVGVARALAGCVRDGDLLARFGGDEFAAVITGVSVDEAAAVAERMRQVVEALDLGCGPARVTIGCIAVPGRASVERAWTAADAALYSGKRAGGNRVVTHVLGAPDGRLVLSRRGHVISVLPPAPAAR